MNKLYTVTVTPRFPTWNNKPFTVEVSANSRREANQRARRQLENEGYHFTQSDAATFRASLDTSCTTLTVQGTP